MAWLWTGTTPAKLGTGTGKGTTPAWVGKAAPNLRRVRQPPRSKTATAASLTWTSMVPTPPPLSGAASSGPTYAPSTSRRKASVVMFRGGCAKGGSVATAMGEDGARETEASGEKRWGRTGRGRRRRAGRSR
ncbi:Os02g0195700 [Oryza sativa Japonica Group]|uniref:Os02g0195700 protein n=1 Tax=Oryza sativa subsp. japonica TaxID=39947 RepID=Q6H7N4_ORYSJ|nr:hypothetical protein [Oryza sativa Japonica Group]BAD25265.1 hypothetical protein [Oryza sativa Japonica Group]BAF08101.1 Os02g0195700 [Oryza sativa Japonica Group]|eukprot:NP_001046187.1 Os02g0195700 [Oryza sativa Japonica Group]